MTAQTELRKASFQSLRDRFDFLADKIQALLLEELTAEALRTQLTPAALAMLRESQGENLARLEYLGDASASASAVMQEMGYVED